MRIHWINFFMPDFLKKLISGRYLGEIMRLVICELIDEGVLFLGQNTYKLENPYVFDTAFLSLMERFVLASLIPIDVLNWRCGFAAIQQMNFWWSSESSHTFLPSKRRLPNASFSVHSLSLLDDVQPDWVLVVLQLLWAKWGTLMKAVKSALMGLSTTYVLSSVASVKWFICHAEIPWVRRQDTWRTCRYFWRERKVRVFSLLHLTILSSSLTGLGNFNNRNIITHHAEDGSGVGSAIIAG